MSEMLDSQLVQMIDRDIPEGREHLLESHRNLENVAAYCEENYMRSPDKRHALEETKNYTTQSLASVAYQINTLAQNFLSLLDVQMNQLVTMESSVNHLSQTVMIHKEKVARREIGVLTANKTTTKPPGVKNPGIVFPEQAERPVKYTRKSIDYACLDEIGHGVKSPGALAPISTTTSLASTEDEQVQQQNPRTRRQSSSSSGKGSITGVSAGQAPTTKPPTPPNHYVRTGTTGTLTRQPSSSPYRTPVSPPSLPSHYAPGLGLQQQVVDGPPTPPVQMQGMIDRRSGYAPGQNMMQIQGAAPPGPPMGKVPPMSRISSSYSTGHNSMMGAPPPTPPSSNRQSSQPGSQHDDSFSDLPPPMPELDYPPGVGRLGNAVSDYVFNMSMGHMLDDDMGKYWEPVVMSPPLPPPPEHQLEYGEHFTPPPPNFNSDFSSSIGNSRDSQQSGPTSWIPQTYLEKVVAIYDYGKDKEDELSFTEGSVIYVIRKNDDGWWEGVMGGITGLFPGNYVEPCI